MNEKKILYFISEAYSDKEIQNNTELAELLLKYAKMLEEGTGYKLVCVKLSNAISRYLVTHKLQFPEALTELFNQIEPEAQKYRGAVSLDMWLNNF
ncbi:bacteriocin immunity protein [Listeria aquatica]|uniref:Prebacteriocin n=1 Tax=Listeria aquatica FSL S10-1188 TaxID=1265818 RepID=W7B0J6_9LIST|nr:bacteriocin immunity protein [Listeria aquatica]EUJ18960.1 prebacteriocin [Listeria aquatica FSL S10-1188]